MASLLDPNESNLRRGARATTSAVGGGFSGATIVGLGAAALCVLTGRNLGTTAMVAVGAGALGGLLGAADGANQGWNAKDELIKHINKTMDKKGIKSIKDDAFYDTFSPHTSMVVYVDSDGFPFVTSNTSFKSMPNGYGRAELYSTALTVGTAAVALFAGLNGFNKTAIAAGTVAAASLATQLTSFYSEEKLNKQLRTHATKILEEREAAAKGQTEGHNR